MKAYFIHSCKADYKNSISEWAVEKNRNLLNEFLNFRRFPDYNCPTLPFPQGHVTIRTLFLTYFFARIAIRVLNPSLDGRTVLGFRAIGSIYWELCRKLTLIG